MTVRLQARPYTGFTSENPPLKGEIFWDDDNRLLGLWNATGGSVDWFRIPRSSEGESLSYIPNHEVDGSRIRFQNADGEWGDWLDSEGPPGPPNTLEPGTFEVVDDFEDAEFTITGQSPNQVLNLKVPGGRQGNPGNNSYLPVASVQMVAPAQPARFVNIGTSQEPSYKLEVPYYPSPIEYGAAFENTNNAPLSPGEYILTRYAPTNMTIKKLIGEVLNSAGSFEVALYIDGVLKSSDLYCSQAYATNLSLNVAILQGQAITVHMKNINGASNAWVQVIGEP